MSYYYKVDEQEEDAEYPTTSLEIAYEELPEPTPDWSNRYRWEQRRNSTISQTPIATPTIPTAIPTETIQTESLEATPTEISYDSLNNVPSMYIPGLSNQAFWAVLSVAIIAILAGILYCWARRNRKRSAEKLRMSLYKIASIAYLATE